MGLCDSHPLQRSPKLSKAIALGSKSTYLHAHMPKFNSSYIKICEISRPLLALILPASRPESLNCYPRRSNARPPAPAGPTPPQNPAKTDIRHLSKSFLVREVSFRFTSIRSTRQTKDRPTPPSLCSAQMKDQVDSRGRKLGKRTRQRI